MTDLQKICREVTALSRSTATFLRKEQKLVKAGDIEFKSLNSLVSYVDKKAEEQLVAGLKKIVPEAGFITEEGTETKRGETYNWVVDPLDGTTNFLHGLPVFAISIALMKNEEVIVGVVLEVGKDECFYAWKGGGAYLNGNAISVSGAQKLEDTLVATGFPYYDFSGMAEFLQLLSIFFQRTRGVRRLGSAATDLAYVACGRFDAYFEYGLSPWDVAAGVLLVQEAGGRVADYKGGQNFIFGGTIAVGSPGIFSEFIELVKHYHS